MTLDLITDPATNLGDETDDGVCGPGDQAEITQSINEVGATGGAGEPSQEPKAVGEGWVVDEGVEAAGGGMGCGGSHVGSIWIGSVKKCDHIAPTLRLRQPAKPDVPHGLAPGSEKLSCSARQQRTSPRQPRERSGLACPQGTRGSHVDG